MMKLNIAQRIAQAYDFITNKEKGFDEPISEGSNIRWQKQDYQ